MDSTIYLKNFIWRLLERVGANGISFVVTIILARILEPDVYGLVALIMVFISVIEVIIDSGIGNALIQKKEVDDIDFSTAFYFSLILSLLLYIVLFFCAPLVEIFYGSVGLVTSIRVLGITVIIASIKNIQQAYVSKNMLFKKFFWATIVGTIFSAAIGIWLAYHGYGIWALIVLHISNNFIDMVMLWITVKWRPTKAFSTKRLAILLSFGWKLLASNLIYKAYSDIRQLLIGKVYNTTDLAYYNQGYKYPDFINAQINQGLNSILLPAMSNAQDDIYRVKSMLRRTIQISQYIMGPLMVGMVVCAKNFVLVFLTEKWLPCVPYLQVFGIVFFIGQMGNANMNAIVSIGRSDIRLRIEIAKTAINMFLLIVTSFISPFAMAIGFLISAYLGLIVCAWPSQKLFGYSLAQQLMDLIPNIILCIFMGTIISLFELLHFSSIITFFTQVIVGGICYIVLSIVTKSESFNYLIRVSNTIMHKDNSNITMNL